MFCAFNRLKGQVSVYRTTGALVVIFCGKIICCQIKNISGSQNEYLYLQFYCRLLA